MGALIRGWRKEWGQGDFPFIYVQKHSGGGCAWDTSNPVTSQGEPFAALPKDVPNDGQYIETHVRIMNYPQTAMAISSDLGSGIHPSNKSGYGQRAAAVALGMVYGKPVEYYGPVYASHTVDGNKVRVKFTHVGKGLAVRHSDKLQGFAIAGEDRKFHWADALIEGDTVVLSSGERRHARRRSVTAGRTSGSGRTCSTRTDCRPSRSERMSGRPRCDWSVAMRPGVLSISTVDKALQADFMTQAF